MNLYFYKYQGAGNDFVLIDNRTEFFDKDNEGLIRRLCDRRFGIGADGLILLQNKEGFDFEMIYFNADGREGSMCGNGGRCIVAFARLLGIIEGKTSFLAVDGPHEAYLTTKGEIALKMGDVSFIEKNGADFILDTGSPHYVKFVGGLEKLDVYQEGRAIRYNHRFKEKGINVNFAHISENGLEVATYERGVEAETLACGTGVTACAIAYHQKSNGKAALEIPIQAKGGNLTIRLKPSPEGYTDIWLIGPAEAVFEGKYICALG